MEHTIKNLQQDLLDLYDKITQCHKDAQNIKKELQGHCDHLHTHDYNTGKQCNYCDWIDLWGTGYFLSPDKLEV